MAKFRHLLKNRNFFLLWLGQIISQFGDRLDQMALIALIYVKAPGSTFQMAKLFSFTIIPVFLIGPIAGVYVDRWDRRRTMYITDFLRGLLVLIIPLFLIHRDSMVLIYILVFLIFCIGRFFIPAKMSIIPDIVKKEELLIANSLISTTGMIAAGIGLGLGGLIVDFLGPRGGFFLDAATFFISSTLIFFIVRKSSLPRYKITNVSKEIIEVVKKSVMSEIKDGLLYLFKLKQMKAVVAVWFILWAGLGSVYIVSIVFVQEALNSMTGILGLLATILCIGLFVGTIFYGKFGQGIPTFKAIFYSLTTAGIVLGAFASTLEVYPSFLIASILAFMLGFAISPITIVSNTLIHQFADEKMLGRTFTSLEITGHLAFLIFMLISAKIAENVARVNILIAVSIIFSIIGIFGIIKQGRSKND